MPYVIFSYVNENYLYPSNIIILFYLEISNEKTTKNLEIEKFSDFL